jgi:exosome complex RNA-binding protein Csl4
MSIDIINMDRDTRERCHRCGAGMKYSVWFDMSYCPKCEPLRLERDVGANL